MNTGIVMQLKQNGLTDFKYKLSIGRLVYFEETKQLYFEDSYQKLHPLEKLAFLKEKWNIEEGNKYLPKPFIIDKDTVTQTGDLLLYGFINNFDDNIVIFGALHDLNLKMFDSLLTYKVNDKKDWDKETKTRNNTKRYYTLHDDGDGGIYFYLEGKKPEEGDPGTGNIVIKIVGTEKNGIAKLETNGIVAINQVKEDGDNEKLTAQVLIDNTVGAEKIQIADQFKNIVTINKDGVSVKTQEKVNIEADKEVNITANDKAVITSKEANITANDKAVITSKEAIITGGKLTVKGKSTPNGQGVFCALPNGQCIFSGAIITSDTVEGT